MRNVEKTLKKKNKLTFYWWLNRCIIKKEGDDWVCYTGKFWQSQNKLEESKLKNDWLEVSKEMEFNDLPSWVSLKECDLSNFTFILFFLSGANYVVMRTRSQEIDYSLTYTFAGAFMVTISYYYDLSKRNLTNIQKLRRYYD